MKLQTIIIIAMVTLFAIAVIAMLWSNTGYAPCSWYQFNANTTLQRKLMETCLN